MGNTITKEEKAFGGCVVIAIIIGIILTLLIVVGYLVPLIIPAIFVLMAPVNYFIYIIKDKKWLSTGFWLTNSERDYFINNNNILATAYSTKSYVQNAVRSEGIAVNNDGQISRKSYRGKDLRAALNNANYDIDNTGPIVKELSLRPYRRWRKARKHYSDAKAFGFAFGAWIISILYFFATDGIYENFSIYFSEMRDNVAAIWDSEKSMSLNAPTSGLWISLIISIAIYIITRIISNILFSKKCKEPPAVSADNVYTYLDDFLRQQTYKEEKILQREKDINEKKERKRKIKEQKKQDKSKQSSSEPIPPSDIPDCSKEEKQFISWAEILKNKGYTVTGNWNNWKNAGQWKSLAVVLPADQTNLRITIEYYTKTKKLYYGIAKLNEEDQISQDLLDSETFRKIMSDCGLTVTNNKWWYCLKYASFDDIFTQYNELIRISKEYYS